VIELERGFLDFLRQLQEIFGRDVLAEEEQHRRLSKSDGRCSPIPLHKKLILLPAPHKRGTVYLVREHCIMYETVYGKRGVSRIYLSDLQVVEVQLPSNKLREMFAAADRIKRRMRHLYLVPRRRDGHLEDAVSSYTALTVRPFPTAGKSGRDIDKGTFIGIN